MVRRFLTVLALAAASILVVHPLAGAQDTPPPPGCAGADTRVTTDTVMAATTTLECLLGLERTARNLPAYTRTSALRTAAARHARDLARNDYFSHVSRSGKTLCDRVRATGYLRGSKRRYHLGETLVYGINADSTPARLAASLLASTAHRRLLLKADLRDLGVGVAAGLPLPGDPRSGATVVVDLGRRITNSSKNFKGAKTCTARRSRATAG